MLFKHIQLKPLIIATAFLMLVQCAGTPKKQVSKADAGNGSGITLDINDLGEGTEIMTAGQELMENALGMVELTNGDQRNDSVLVIAVHGYESKGYEWITGLKNFADYYGSLFFYRYDWEVCPDQVAGDLAAHVIALSQKGSYDKILLFGHSYGGVVLTFAASELGALSADLHVIAAPLSGFPSLMDACKSMSYDAGDKLKYPHWKKSIRVIQHKTVHAQDGAFRELAADPQEIDLPFYMIKHLPPTMDGHRLGHNWSVTWVLDQHIGKPHR